MVCIHIGNSSGHIEQTQSRFPKCLWMFETERNAYRIGIINIIDSLFNPDVDKAIDTGYTTSTDCNTNYGIILLMMSFITH